MRHPINLCVIMIGTLLGGHNALAQCFLCSDGYQNTAAGSYALYSPSLSGSYNAALGYSALISNTAGYSNTAAGFEALYSNTTGNYNTGLGYGSLAYNLTGASNTALGSTAMLQNTTGANNTALGAGALYSNSMGKGNAAQGMNALYFNTTGIRNVGIGNNVLFGNVSGSYNTAIGFNAGYNQTGGNDNIYLANQGVAGESQVLRLGTQGTSGTLGSGITSAYIAGVATTQVTGSAVYITSAGQLGVLASSERFKTNVETMGGTSERLAMLRPVTFTLKTDSTGTTQYGLIAEEVAKVYPELVIHGADGRIDGVRYEELTPILLREVQQQREQLVEQSQRFRGLQQQMLQMNATLSRLQANEAPAAGR